MKRFLLLAALSIVAAVSCSKGPQSPFAHRVADYAVVTFEAPDLSGITDNGKEVLRLYRYAADVVDSIYWQQYFGDRQALLDGIEDPYQKTFAEINYGKGLLDRKSTRLNSSHITRPRMPSSA